MNEEFLKNTLLEIIKETENLAPSELEVIPGTNIYVKKGKVDEFKANARFYFQLKNNVDILDDSYITQVYDELSEEIKNELNEYAYSKAYDLNEMNKPQLEQFEALNKSLAINNKDREKYVKILDDLNRRKTTEPQVWEEITRAQRALKGLDDNEIFIKNALVEIKNKVNGEIKKVIEEEMEFLRSNYLNTRVGTKTAFGLDGVSILANDKENYDNLYILMRIIENVDDKGLLVCANNTICVNPWQVDAALELLPKIKILSLAATKSSKLENEPKKPNDDIIMEVSHELDRLRDKIAKDNLISDRVEYDKLIKILNYLNKANNSVGSLVSVWGIAYVDGLDREKFANLLKQTEFFKGRNPDIIKIKENDELINNLKKYLEQIENNARNYSGAYNVPLAQINGRNILLNDKEEYENVLNIIGILSDSRDNLINVSNNGNVTYDSINKYRDLLAKTKYFTPQINNSKLEEIKSKNALVLKQISENIKTLKANPNDNSNQQLDLIGKQFELIQTVNVDEPIIEVNGAYINVSKETQYRQIIDELAKLKKEENLQKDELLESPIEPVIQAGGTNEPIALGSAEPINSSEETVDYQINPALSNPENGEEKSDKIELSESFMEPVSLAPIVGKEELDNGPIPIKFETKFKSESEPTKAESKRKIVTKIRKLKDKNWWKEHKILLVAVGLISVSVMINVLTTLVPSIVYANACAIKLFPALSSVLGPINNLLVNTFGVSMSSLNFNVSALNLLGASFAALAKLGIVTGGAIYGIKKIKKHFAKEPSEEEKKSLLTKVKGLAEQAINKTRDLKQNLANKAVSFAENLGNATNAFDNSYQDANIDPVPEVLEDDNNVLDSSATDMQDDVPVVDIPSNDEIFASIDNKDLYYSYVDKYIEALRNGDNNLAGKIRIMLVENTSVDVAQYDFTNPQDIEAAKKDISDFIDSVTIKRRSSR